MTSSVVSSNMYGSSKGFKIDEIQRERRETLEEYINKVGFEMETKRALAILFGNDEATSCRRHELPSNPYEVLVSHFQKVELERTAITLTSADIPEATLANHQATIFHLGAALTRQRLACQDNTNEVVEIEPQSSDPKNPSLQMVSSCRPTPSDAASPSCQTYWGPPHVLQVSPYHVELFNQTTKGNVIMCVVRKATLSEKLL